jgi:hypothetical protein
LRRLLHDGRDLLDENLGRRVLVVDLPVRLGRLPRLGHKRSEVRTHAGVDDADVGADDGDALNGRLIDEDRGRLLLRGDDDAVGG